MEELLDGLDRYMKDKTYPAEFGARFIRLQETIRKPSDLSESDRWKTESKRCSGRTE